MLAVLPSNTSVSPTDGTVDPSKIFACDDGEGVLSCILHVARNMWGAVSDTFSAAKSVGVRASGSLGVIGSGATGALNTGQYAPSGDLLYNTVANSVNIINSPPSDPFGDLIKRVKTIGVVMLVFVGLLMLGETIRNRKEEPKT